MQYAQATQGGGRNYSLAKVIHWLHTSDGQSTSRVEESEKLPLENRVWYNYPNQPNSIYSGVSSGGVITNGFISRPSVIGRVLDDGSTQLWKYQYNAQGSVTQVTDPAGRTTSYTYAANGIDLLTVSNTTSGTQLLQKRTYNSQHEPLTITGTDGTTEKFQYNAAGELTRYTDQQGHVTTRTYDANGYLKVVQNAVTGSIGTFAYDSAGRVAATTDAAGLTQRFTYDAADRLLTTTMPDGTVSLRTYNLLDLASSTDRLGQKTSFTWNADRQLTLVTDPLGNTLQRGYNNAGRLNSITDPNGHTVNLVLDIQGRITSKQYAGGTSDLTIYENGTSRVASYTDPAGQVTSYTYNDDDTVHAVSYSANVPTPSVVFTYDPVYLRRVSMTDGTGTSRFTYYPVSAQPTLGANRLASITTPVAGGVGYDTVTYSYDALGRVATSTVNGAVETLTYDAIGRPVTISNPLDTFTYSYSDATSGVTGISSNNGPAQVIGYYGPTGDQQLRQLTTTQGGVLVRNTRILTTPITMSKALLRPIPARIRRTIPTT